MKNILHLSANQVLARMAFDAFKPKTLWFKCLAPHLRINDGNESHYFFHAGEAEHLRGMEFSRVIADENVTPSAFVLSRIRRIEDGK